MGTTIAGAQSQIDAPEFARWVAYFRLYPPNALNFYFARLTKIVASMFRGDSAPPELNDFLLFGDRPLDDETEEEKQDRIAESIGRSMSAAAIAWKKNHPVG